ncbi:MAG: retropepsin-like domain-containing protein [Alphaproteobacteria bacterium]|nr:retropepsin-like domain-containing protein [Alphaproteobacteria bacterium]
MRGLVWALAVALLVSASAAAESDDCAKIKGFAIGLNPTEDGYLMPLGVARTPRQFLLDLGAAYTKMDEAIAVSLNFPTKSLPYGLHVQDSGGRFTKIAVVPTLEIGPITRKDVEVLIGAHRNGWGPAADGVAAINIFYGLDIELDLAHNRLGLYLPRDNCAFAPFWPAVEWGSGDFMTAPTGGMYTPMNLDGAQLIVTFNTTEGRTYMPFDAAHRLFRIEENDHRLVPVGARASDGKAVYRFPFTSLSGGHNVTVQDPEIYIVKGETSCGGTRDLNNWKWGEASTYCFGGGDLQLGINLLKKLHFFFSFKDKKVYFTLAEPPAAK